MHICTNGRDYSRSGRVVIDDEHIIAYSLPCPNCGFEVGDTIYIRKQI